MNAYEIKAAMAGKKRQRLITIGICALSLALSAGILVTQNFEWKNTGYLLPWEAQMVMTSASWVFWMVMMHAALDHNFQDDKTSAKIWLARGRKSVWRYTIAAVLFNALPILGWLVFG